MNQIPIPCQASLRSHMPLSFFIFSNLPYIVELHENPFHIDESRTQNSDTLVRTKFGMGWWMQWSELIDG